MEALEGDATSLRAAIRRPAGSLPRTTKCSCAFLLSNPCSFGFPSMGGSPNISAVSWEASATTTTATGHRKIWRSWVSCRCLFAAALSTVALLPQLPTHKPKLPTSGSALCADECRRTGSPCMSSTAHGAVVETRLRFRRRYLLQNQFPQYCGQQTPHQSHRLEVAWRRHSAFTA